MEGEEDSSPENNHETTENNTENKENSVPMSAKPKKKRKKTGFLSAQYRRASNTLNKKPFQTHLPVNLCECSWLENTPKNV